MGAAEELAGVGLHSIRALSTLAASQLIPATPDLAQPHQPWLLNCTGSAWPSTATAVAGPPTNRRNDR